MARVPLLPPFSSTEPLLRCFPLGIPFPIVAGQTDHLKPRPDLGQDNDWAFEPVPNLEEWEKAGFPEEARDP